MFRRRSRPPRPFIGAVSVLMASLVLASCSPPPPAIEVTEVDGLFAPLDVQLTGLSPGSEVTLGSSTVLDYVRFEADATFTVPDGGVVDLAEVAPSSGDWDVADPMAPLWAMSAGKPTYLEVWDEPHTIELELRDEADAPLAETTIDRPGAAPGVEVRSVDDDGLVAEYVLPSHVEDRVDRPAVLVFGGSEGGLYGGSRAARWLAGVGYPALGISYFGSAGQPAELEEVPVETFLAALDWLHDQPEVETVTTFGASRGGEMALWLAAEHPDLVDAAIAPTGAGQLACGYPDSSVPAWTLGGQPLSDTCSGSPGSSPDAAIDAAGIEGPVVLACGSRDELWEACGFAEDILERRGDATTLLTRADGAGHAVTLAPYVPGGLGPDTFADLGVTSTALPAATHQVRVEFWEDVVETLEDLSDEG